MNPSAFSLQGKVALVTGGGRGIGKAIALGFADAGADVAVAARTASEIEATASQIRDKGRKSIAIPTDVTVPEQVKALVDRTAKEFGRIDILLNAPAVAFQGYFLDMTEKNWDKVIRGTLTSGYLCSRAVAPIMREQKKGSIINISAGYGITAAPGMAAYGAAKAGVISLTQSLAVEWAPHGIRINSIAPGFIITERSQLIMTGNASLLEAHLKDIPLGRPGKPEDIANIAIYLASDASSYVTGETFRIHGGVFFPKSVVPL